MRRFNPSLFGFLYLLQGLLRSFNKSGAGIQVWDVGDVAAVLLAIKNIVRAAYCNRES